uniref:Glabrous enhancer-binding protein-like DBD domain-containing protein n=1 Tax=Kalanchoe fedtschenkoi TaxID=63787 RepID=A0A7N0U861_KALFE
MAPKKPTLFEHPPRADASSNNKEEEEEEESDGSEEEEKPPRSQTKRLKKSTLPPVAEKNSEKQLFQRLFGEDDEIVVLKGMLEYSAGKGIDPMDELNGFYDFVKGSIHVDVTGAQLFHRCSA